MDKKEAEGIANRIFDGTRYAPTKDEIARLARNILSLHKAGLGNLNQRLIKGGRKILDTFVEHNFAADLISLHGQAMKIEYEPKNLQQPPDFKILMGSQIYWVQVKNLADLERDNRLNKIMQDLKRAASKIPVRKYFRCELSHDFCEKDLKDLKEFVSRIAEDAEVDKEYPFPDEKMCLAKIIFWNPRNSKISNLTLRFLGDMEMVNLTGLAPDQIRKSVRKASDVFRWNTSEREINIVTVAMDSGNYDDIDVCDALFGTEYECSHIDINGKIHRGWSRKKDGLFLDKSISEKISGVITLKRKNKSSPVSAYEKSIYLNEENASHLGKLEKLFPNSLVVRFNMRPPMGQGDFTP